MLKRFRIVGLCLVAVFALSAVGASSASAEWTISPWMDYHSGEWHTVTTKLNVNSKGTLILKNGTDVVECSGTNEGSVEASGKDKINTITVTTNPCKLIEHNGCSGTQPSNLPKATALNLPWNTQLEDEPTSGSMRDKITSGTIKGNPGWSVTCKSILGGETTASCTNAEETTMIKNIGMGFNAEFNTAGEPATCTGNPFASKGGVKGTIEFTVAPGQFIGTEEVKGIRAN